MLFFLPFDDPSELFYWMFIHAEEYSWLADEVQTPEIENLQDEIVYIALIDKP